MQDKVVTRLTFNQTTKNLVVAIASSSLHPPSSPPPPLTPALSLATSGGSHSNIVFSDIISILVILLAM